MSHISLEERDIYVSYFYLSLIIVFLVQNLSLIIYDDGFDLVRKMERTINLDGGIENDIEF